MEEWLQCKECLVVLPSGPALATHFRVQHDINILQLDPSYLNLTTTRLTLTPRCPLWEQLVLQKISVDLTPVDTKAAIKLIATKVQKTEQDVALNDDEDDEEARLLREMEEELLLAEMEALDESQEDGEDIYDDDDDEEAFLEGESSSVPSSDEEQEDEANKFDPAVHDRPYRRVNYNFKVEAESEIAEDKSWPNTMPKDFICCKCLNTFDSRDELEEHKKSHVGERLFPCLECEAAFTCATHLQYHKLEHSDEWDWLKKHPKELRKRRRQIRLEVTRVRRKLYRPRELQQCPHCPRKFPFSTNLKRHILRHTDKRPHVCKTCGCSYFDGWGLRKHLALNKCQEVLALSASRTWQCDVCHQRLKTEKGLRGHQRRFHGAIFKRSGSKKHLKCMFCGYLAANAHALSEHQISHTGEKNWECEAKCGAKFGLRTNMMSHMRRHCALAEALGIGAKLREEKAKRQANTSTHRKNNGPADAEYKFTCEECGDKFPELGRLTVHKQSHGDAFKCEVCSAGFRHTMGLALHKKRVHPDHVNPDCKFKCKVCGAPFQAAYRLKVHMIDVHGTHADQKNFKPVRQRQHYSSKCEQKPSTSFTNPTENEEVKTETTETTEATDFQNILNVLGDDEGQIHEDSVNMDYFLGTLGTDEPIEDEEIFEGGGLVVLDDNHDANMVCDNEDVEDMPVLGEWKKFEFLDNLS